MLRTLFGVMVGLGLSGCATVPDRCYIVISKDGVEAELCQTRDKLHLLGTPKLTTGDIPVYVKGLLAYEGIAYVEDGIDYSTNLGNPLTK
ncbi:MAG: hypothetical protein KKH72_10795 [Alphaproteobacteria bacterium]|nr:hypothetical protein [Alphaproteobacteria bacterium]